MRYKKERPYPIKEIHWRLYEKDIRAFQIFMARRAINDIADAFHELADIRDNQPPSKMIVQ